MSDNAPTKASDKDAAAEGRKSPAAAVPEVDAVDQPLIPVGTGVSPELLATGDDADASESD